jgi:hypothetical protein
VAKPSNPSKKNKSGPGKKPMPQHENWLPTRTGLIAVGVVSLILAVMITIQATKVSSLGESVLYGLGFGASIWVVFGLVYFVNKFLRSR